MLHISNLTEKESAEPSFNENIPEKASVCNKRTVYPRPMWWPSDVMWTVYALDIRIYAHDCLYG